MKAFSEIDSIVEVISHSSENVDGLALEQIKDFIRQNQLESGAFADRSGRPDLYYSFFGFLLCSSLSMAEELKKLESYILNTTAVNDPSHVDSTILAILRYAFHRRFFFKLKKSFQLAGSVVFNLRKKAEVYDYFFMLLIFNYYWGWSRCISEQIDKRISPLVIDEQSPCSHLAAMLLIRTHALKTVDELASELKIYATESGAFAAFRNHNSPDLLSTAVAVYALFQSKSDIRLFAPECLQFVNHHFDNGAFLSGDGDPTRDLEYTFYGLLALNSISQNLNHHGYYQ